MKLKNMMDTLGLPEDQPIQNKIISKTIESAQSKIEGFNFDIRKHVLEYDDVMNKQREVIYKKRKEILGKEDIKNNITDDAKDEMEKIVSLHCIDEEVNWDIDCVFNEANNIFPIKEEARNNFETIRGDKSKNEIEKKGAMLDYLVDLMKQAYNQKEAEISPENMRRIEKLVALQTIDNYWMNHLDEIDYIRQGIGLRGYGQRDPLVEYKREAFDMFSHLVANIQSAIVRTMFRISMVPAGTQKTQEQEKNMQFKGADESIGQFGGKNNIKPSESGESEEIKQKPIINKDKVGRNDPCPCGKTDPNTGKSIKYKKCCGK